MYLIRYSQVCYDFWKDAEIIAKCMHTFLQQNECQSKKSSRWEYLLFIHQVFAVHHDGSMGIVVKGPEEKSVATFR